MTIRKITNTVLGNIGTTKYLSLTTAETVFTIEPATRAFEITNVGSYTVCYGKSALTIGSAGLLTSYGSKFVDHIVGDFTWSLKTLSSGITGGVVIQEYEGI